MDKKMADGLRKRFRDDEVQVVDMGKYKADYVGHANVTDRLLEVDPEWTWSPVAVLLALVTARSRSPSPTGMPLRS